MLIIIYIYIYIYNYITYTYFKYDIYMDILLKDNNSVHELRIIA